MIFNSEFKFELNFKVSRGNDYQLKKLIIVKQILLVGTSGDEWRTVWRICALM